MTDAISEGVAAWQRIRETERRSWDDWLKVGHALVAGRAQCMLIANVNEPKGGKFNYTACQWLRDHGFSDMWPGERMRIIKIIENLPAISAWRDSLSPERRQRINHPSCWLTYRREVLGQKRRQAERPCAAPIARLPANRARPVYFTQDMIRRGAMAIKEARSNDLFILARACLEAAISNENDLADLVEGLAERKRPASPLPALEVA